ncbi:sodium/calcium exchanger ncl [Anaeramoeba flamelloides]|uniref:Sodium/calcium exchanger ncl n=1 Tax=Anaeramoeba flamelloides TaxID=1746091 RepID=A0ABQ8X453_9EUKA|nr:sodium/calcium exchanger ncl [Anaeramoeba flamelloides]
MILFETCLSETLPCSESTTGNLFLLIIYSLVLGYGSKNISDGSELLIEITPPGIIGGIILPLLGTLPDSCIIIASCIFGTKEEVQHKLSVAVGTLAGSDVLLLTLPLAAGIYLGRCDIENGEAIPQRCTEFSFTKTGVTVFSQIRVIASLVIVSLISFVLVQLGFNSCPGCEGEKLEEHEEFFNFSGMVLSGLLFIGYTIYQFIETTLQSKRNKLAKEKLLQQKLLMKFSHKVEKEIQFNIISSKVRKPFGIRSEEGDLNEKQRQIGDNDHQIHHHHHHSEPERKLHSGSKSNTNKKTKQNKKIKLRSEDENTSESENFLNYNNKENLSEMSENYRNIREGKGIEGDDEGDGINRKETSDNINKNENENKNKNENETEPESEIGMEEENEMEKDKKKKRKRKNRNKKGKGEATGTQNEKGKRKGNSMKKDKTNRNHHKKIETPRTEHELVKHLFQKKKFIHDSTDDSYLKPLKLDIEMEEKKYGKTKFNKDKKNRFNLKKKIKKKYHELDDVHIEEETDESGHEKLISKDMISGESEDIELQEYDLGNESDMPTPDQFGDDNRLKVRINKRKIALKATYHLLIGTASIILFCDALVVTITKLSARIGMSPYYIAFVVAPTASNSAELFTSVIFAKKKTKNTISLVFASLYGAVIMNNTFSLAVLCGLIYYKKLIWDFTAEVISLSVVNLLLGILAIRTTTVKVFHIFWIIPLYPLSILIVYILNRTLGWD